MSRRGRDLLTWKNLAIYAGAVWFYDLVVRPARVAEQARAAARARKKPLLNVGAGTPGSSVRVALLGSTLVGDHNCDYAARKDVECGGPALCFCDIQNLPYPDKFFGAVIASHVLEHVQIPELALRELHRVADEVFVITPPWWAPHTWLQPGHRWFVSPSGRYYPLWQ